MELSTCVSRYLKHCHSPIHGGQICRWLIHVAMWNLWLQRLVLLNPRGRCPAPRGAIISMMLAGIWPAAVGRTELNGSAGTQNILANLIRDCSEVFFRDLVIERPDMVCQE